MINLVDALLLCNGVRELHKLHALGMHKNIQNNVVGVMVLAYLLLCLVIYLFIYLSIRSTHCINLINRFFVF